jgi:hypothetical protein
MDKDIVDMLRDPHRRWGVLDRLLESAANEIELLRLENAILRAVDGKVSKIVRTAACRSRREQRDLVEQDPVRISQGRETCSPDCGPIAVL